MEIEMQFKNIEWDDLTEDQKQKYIDKASEILDDSKKNDVYKIYNA
jgi:hypothetical protein